MNRILTMKKLLIGLLFMLLLLPLAYSADGLNTPKIQFTKQQVAGIVLLPVSGTIALTGLSLLVYDIAAYFPRVNTALYDGTTYGDYYNTYMTNIALFSLGIGLFIGGIGITSAAMTLLFYKKKNKSAGLDIRTGHQMQLAITYKF